VSQLSTHAGDFMVTGRLIAGSFTPPSDSVSDASVVAAAGVQASKLEHQYEPVFSQEGGTNAAAEVRVVHVVKGATADLVSFHAGSVVAATSTGTCTVDLKKNGTTCLSAPITLDSSNTAYTVEAGTLSVLTAAAGDVLTVTVAGVSGTNLPQGVFARLVIREDAQ
jgi:hypothetical protein